MKVSYGLFKIGKRYKFLINLYLVLVTNCVIAQTDTQRTSFNQLGSYVDVQALGNKTNRLQLSFKDATIEQVLKKLTLKTGIAIHYSNLSIEQISSSCNGDLKTVLLCVTGKGSNLIYRYNNKLSNSGQVAEVWFLPLTNLSTPFKNTEEKNTNISVLNDDSLYANTSRLLQEANDPELRMNAIERLAIEGQLGDIKVYNLLKKTLSDANPGVRAQALYGLIRQDQENKLPFLEQAMTDSSADVRLMAVDNSGDNPWILQQALNDEDSNVRDLAKAKLAIENKIKQ